MMTSILSICSFALKFSEKLKYCMCRAKLKEDQEENGAQKSKGLVLTRSRLE